MLCHVRGIFAMAAPDARGGYHVVAVDTSEIDTLKAAKQHVKLVDEGAGGRWKVTGGTARKSMLTGACTCV